MKSSYCFLFFILFGIPMFGFSQVPRVKSAVTLSNPSRGVYPIAFQDSSFLMTELPGIPPRSEWNLNYPEEAIQSKREGVVYIEFYINREGKVMYAEVTGSSGFPDLDHAALDAIFQLLFVPGKIKGRVVETKLFIPIRFSLPK